MACYKIKGGNPLHGEVTLQGSKNAALPVLAAAVINGGVSVIHNCPDLSDVASVIDILSLLGCRVRRDKTDVYVDSTDFTSRDIPLEIMKQTRSSCLFAGALLARCKRAFIAGSGGCCIGRRPINIHLKAFREMGAEILDDAEGIICKASRLHGGRIVLDFPSVGATENIMIASSLTPSYTIICNAAKEPEIINLAQYLRSIGVKISGDGTEEIRIKGTCTPKDGEVSIIPDRIVASTYVTAVACCGGSVKLLSVNARHLSSVITAYRKMGMQIDCFKNTMTIQKNHRLVNLPFIFTSPYPGFPTDCQPLIMAAMANSYGVGIVNERIFENRFGHCQRLAQFGADVEICGRNAIIRGVDTLKGANADACDLRCGAALTCASLGAQGESIISGIGYIDRGYEDLSETLKNLGADIERTE